MKKVPESSSYTPLRPLKDLAPYLLGWYDTVHTNRGMPWRQTRDPYAIWLSETMLQQTQVETVKPYYHRFLQRFPTVSDLARADLDSVLTLWAGLGYYRRARNLHAAAQAIVEHHSGQLPSSLEDLLELPGVGRYTAGAVASIAFGLPAPVVDGNVMRVIARLTGFDRNIADPKNAPFFWDAATEIVRGNAAAASSASKSAPRPGDVNQAMMELGATVCVPAPARPACLQCPIKAFCRAFAEGRQLELPVKEKKKPVPEIRGTAFVILRKKKGAGGSIEVLMMKRPAGVTWENMWEFPVLPAEVFGKRMKRSQASIDALGMRLVAPGDCGEVVHTLTHRRMVYGVMSACWKSGEPYLPTCNEGGSYTEARWVEWPLAKHRGMAFGRVVERIAEAASRAFSKGAAQ